MHACMLNAFKVHVFIVMMDHLLFRFFDSSPIGSMFDVHHHVSAKHWLFWCCFECCVEHHVYQKSDSSWFAFPWVIDIHAVLSKFKCSAQVSKNLLDSFDDGGHLQIACSHKFTLDAALFFAHLLTFSEIVQSFCTHFKILFLNPVEPKHECSQFSIN